MSNFAFSKNLYIGFCTNYNHFSIPAVQINSHLVESVRKIEDGVPEHHML